MTLGQRLVLLAGGLVRPCVLDCFVDLGGLVFRARLLYHSTLGSRVIKTKRSVETGGSGGWGGSSERG